MSAEEELNQTGTPSAPLSMEVELLNLPKDVSAILKVSGPLTETSSSQSEPAKNITSFQFEEGTEPVFQLDHSLADAIVSTPLDVTIVDAESSEVLASASSGGVVLHYQDTIDHCIDMLVHEFPGQCTTSDFIESLRVRGHYHDIYRTLHLALVPVLRERIRKDPLLHSRKKFMDQEKDSIMSDAYVYLCREIADRLEMHSKLKGFPADRPDNVQKGLSDQQDLDQKYTYLAREYEVCGLWDRAAACYQNRMLMEANSTNLQLWIDYSKFCLRAEGRSTAAEEGLISGLEKLGQSADKISAAEAGCILGAQFIARGRHKEAHAQLRPLVDSDMTRAQFNFLLGLNHYMAGDEEMGKQWLQLASRRKSFFALVRTEEAIMDKLKLYMEEDEESNPTSPLDPSTCTPVDENDYPYLEMLEMLLSYGLPELVLYVMQIGLLKRTTLGSERLAVIEAKALLAQREWVLAEEKLDTLLLKSGAAESYLLVGEARYQLARLDPATADLDLPLHDLQTGLDILKRARVQGGTEDYSTLDLDKVHLRVASILTFQKRFQEANTHFQESIKTCPSATAWAGVGLTYLRQHKLQKAYVALSEALLKDESRGDIWAQLALVHIAMNNWSAAESAFTIVAEKVGAQTDKIDQIEEKRKKMVDHLGDVEADELDEITEQIDRVVRAEPHSDEFLLEICEGFLERAKQQVLRSQGKVIKDAVTAETSVRLAIKLRDTGRARILWADALELQGRIEECVFRLTEAMGLLYSVPEQRKECKERALNLAEQIQDALLIETINLADKKADIEFRNELAADDEEAL
eukprot:gene324-426_t